MSIEELLDLKKFISSIEEESERKQGQLQVLDMLINMSLDKELHQTLVNRR